ncbi:MAG: hypothetical protein JO056_05865 [Alphaproteobacteria bacterium]|uniref:hypothetical protein n=1 Tax=Bradyrhizobium sp. TaxID=376 RepID=UPI001EB28812|nr:hypothetical protein [Bradyrhizobium sp.]MBV9570748.1 hypothetical protein [Alphaproteobacteria bacterium]MBV9978999.1 hypothetical protein [Bradyrhizobium sp.]
MQLKIQRSQRASGLVSKSVMFCVDARIHLTAEERDNIQKYRLGSQVLYSSEAAKRHAEAASGEHYESGKSWMRGIYHAAAARMALSITVDSLQRGQRIECKDLNEVLDAEEALKEACQSLRTYLLLAQTFDGGELVWDYTEMEPRLVSAPALSAPIPAITHAPPISAAPQPQLDAPAMAAAIPAPSDAGSVAMNFQRAGAGDSPLDALTAWWSSLTNEQRKWLLIVGGIVLLILLYEIL